MVKIQANSQGKIYVTTRGKVLELNGPNISSLNVTPTTSAQTITAPSGTDGYSPINVSAVTSSIDANITAGNIKKDVTILGVTGTLESGSGTPYTTIVALENTMRGTSEDASDEEAQACDDISLFLYGTTNS